MQDHRNKPLRRWVMEGRRLSTELLDNRQQQDILLGRAEPSKSGPAEKASSAPKQNCAHQQWADTSWAGQGCWCHPPLAEYNLSASLQQLRNLAWFPASSNACLLEPRAMQQDLLPGKQHLSQQSGDGRRQMEPPPSTWSRLLGWPSAEVQSCHQVVSSILCRCSVLGSRGTQEKGEEQQAFSNMRKKFFKTYFQWILTGFCVHLLLHISSFCACQGFRELLLEVCLEAELPKNMQTNPMPKQHSIHSFRARWGEHKTSKKKNFLKDTCNLLTHLFWSNWLHSLRGEKGKDQHPKGTTSIHFMSSEMFAPTTLCTCAEEMQPAAGKLPGYLLFKYPWLKCLFSCNM